MIFTKELLLKGLAGVSLCAGVAGVGIHIYKSGEVKITDPQGQLGLPADCALPANNTPVTCNITTENISKINDIKFDGKNNTEPTLTGSGSSLQITIAESKDTNFPHGYKFTLTPSGGSLTINREESAGGNIVIKAGKSSDFKVKKTNDGFSLEEAFTLNTLTNKLADFTCTNGECQIGSTAISIKQGDHKESKTKTNPQTTSPVGKIKVYSGEEDYNKGFKFVIEDGDIDLTGSDGTSITKLEQFETYEINKESDAWVLARKYKASEVIKKALGLPTECTMPEGTETECTSLDANKLKAIKFEGKGREEGITVEDDNYSNVKLKISKTTATNKTVFPHGFKFVLESDKDITIPQGSNTAITIMKRTNTEFKIKKTGEGKNTTLTLEKAWTLETLREKVGLTTCEEASGVKQCGFGSSSINVYVSENSFVKGASLANGSTEKKMTYEEGVQGYSQGIKFTSAEDLTLQGGTGASGQTVLAQINGTSGATSASYEIKEINGAWYLVKKTNVGG